VLNNGPLDYKNYMHDLQRIKNVPRDN